MSMEWNKIFGAILLAGLIAMLSGFIAEVLVAPTELEENVYVVAGSAGTETGEAASEEPAGPEPIAPLLAAADPAAGQRLSRACAACHDFSQGGPNKVGPNLWGIVGADIASKEGFSYSNVLAEMEGEWTYDRLNEFLYDPKAFAPGTKMNYAGMRDVEDRAALIAWMRSLHDNPPPLPEAAAAEPAEAEPAAAEPAAVEAAEPAQQ